MHVFPQTRQMKRLAAAGSYGKVTSSVEHPNRAIKRTKLFHNHILNGANIVEAAFVKAMMRKDVQVRNHIDVVNVTVDEKNRADILIEMERGTMSLHDWIHATKYSTRMKMLPVLIKELCTALYDLHEHGMVHCDFKPCNVIMVPGEGEGGTPKPRLIDFGSVRFCDSASKVVCTYPFCAPEAFIKGAVPTPACDAYSLGATIHYFIYKSYLYESRWGETATNVLRLHQEGMVVIPERPSSVDPEIFDIMCELLHPDPTKRLKISTLYYRLSGNVIELCNGSPKICLDPRKPIESTHWNMQDRAQAIDVLFTGAKTMKCSMLSVNILDRYVDASGCVPNETMIKAAGILAEMVLHPEWKSVRLRALKDAIVAIVTKLNFALFTETADAMLFDKGHREVDYTMLKDVLKETWGSTEKIARVYDVKYMKQIRPELFTPCVMK